MISFIYSASILFFENASNLDLMSSVVKLITRFSFDVNELGSQNQEYDELPLVYERVIYHYTQQKHL